MSAAAASGPARPREREFEDWIDFRPVAKEVTRVPDLIPDVANLIATFVAGTERIGVFGSNFWNSRGVDAGEVRPIDPAFYDYWYNPDPVDPTRRVCDTHHRPVWIPEGLSLATVERAGLRFSPNRTEALREIKNIPTRGGYYAVMRKEIFGKSLPEAEQIQKLNEAGYPGLAKAVDVAAVIFAINQYDGSRWLGDDTGVERRWTMTRCVEKFSYRVWYSWRTYKIPVVVGIFSPSGVYVNDFYNHYIGVVGLRKF